MHRLLKAILVMLLSAGALSSCQSETNMSEQDCVALITGITSMPLKMGIEVDGDYYSVFERLAEKEIAECLLSQITNTDAVDLMTMSPGPKPQFVVGDVSVFMLTDMYDIPYTTFLSQEEWAQMGIFEYYRYAQTDGARETITKKLRPLVEEKFH